jgi:hypothetical protein
MKARTALLSFLATIAGASLNAQLVWNGVSSSDWNDRFNWSTQEVPAIYESVAINNAAAPHQPILSSNVNIVSLTLSGGTLDLNGFTISCSGAASLNGDSLKRGKIVAPDFSQVANLKMVGKIVLEKTNGSTNNTWYGNNKVTGDSLVINWYGGTLSLEAGLPDSVFTDLKVRLVNNSGLYLAGAAKLYVGGDLVVDNPGGGTVIFGVSGAATVIGGNLIGQRFEGNTSNLVLRGVDAAGVNNNGPFYCHSGEISQCVFAGGFSMKADSSQVIMVGSSSLLGADNLLQAGSFDVQGSRFGQAGPGVTRLRAAHNIAGNVYLREGNNVFVGNAQWETWAVMPGGITIQQTFYGADSCFGDLSFVLGGNAALFGNSNGHSFVGGDLVIDGQGKRKWVQFTGGTAVSLNIAGNFIVKNFSPLAETGVGNTNVYLRDIIANGADSCGTFYCYSGDISNCSFNGRFRLIGDSSQGFILSNSQFLGAENYFQSGTLEFHGNNFGREHSGSSVFRFAHNIAGNVFARDGNNKFLGDARFETYAQYPGGITIQQTFYGADTCLGNLTFVLGGNAALFTNINGHSFVGGNLVVDAQGKRKWVEFTGASAVSLNVAGSLGAKNFSQLPEAGVSITDVILRNLTVSGSDSIGSFYCYTGEIVNSSFNGGIRVVGDSSQTFNIRGSSLLGPDNVFQAGDLDFYGSHFGKAGQGLSLFKVAHNLNGNVYMREGNNIFYNDAAFETYALSPGGVTIQQTFYGPDSCFGNLRFGLGGNTALVTNLNGNSYVAGDLEIDGYGRRKWVQFTGGTAISYTVGGSLLARNFTSQLEAGVATTSIQLHNLTVSGTDSVGTFYCTTGDINSSSLGGGIRLIADSSQYFGVYNSSLLGGDNFIQAGTLDLNNNRFGKVGSGTSQFRAAHNVPGNLNLRDGNNRFLGDVSFELKAPAYGELYFQQTFYGSDSCLGNFSLDMNGPASANLAGNNLYMARGMSVTNNGTGSIVQDIVSSAIHFTGNDTAGYSFAGTGSSPLFAHLVMERRGGLRLLSPLSCSAIFGFTRGIVLSSTVNPLQLLNGATVTGAWDSSYVDGAVKKTGNSAFTFPLGADNVYAPLGISTPALATDEFMGSYVHHIAHDYGFDSTLHDQSLNHLSRTEYWMLDRVTGSSTVKITLSWKTERSGVVDAINDLRVAHWNGSTWKDEGKGTTTGNESEGSIESFNAISSFSPFTLASTTINNPLPVEYVYFIASLEGDHNVLLSWETGNEGDNTSFEIEKSVDARTWMVIGKVNSNDVHRYTFNDNQFIQAVAYYRIRQVDGDGTSSYSVIRMIRQDETGRLVINPNPATSTLTIHVPPGITKIEVFNALGARVWMNPVELTVTTINVQAWPSGVYTILATGIRERRVVKFIKQ